MQCGFTNDGGVEDCAPFKPSLDPDFSKSCPERPSLLNEPVHGMIDKLPGCVTITSGPQDATEAEMTCAGGQTSAKESVQSLNSTLDAGSNLTGAATILTKVSTTKVSASAEATNASQDHSDDEDDNSPLVRRDVSKGQPLPQDEPSEYGYDHNFPPTPTHHPPSPPNGSPVSHPHGRRNKRAVPHQADAEDNPNSYSYTYDYPPQGSPAPRAKHNNKHYEQVNKLETES